MIDDMFLNLVLFIYNFLLRGIVGYWWVNYVGL